MKRQKWTTKDVLYIQRIAQDAISLSTPIGNQEDDYAELGDIIPDNRPGPEELVMNNSTRDRLLGLIKAHLSPKEQKVIIMRYGFEECHNMTLEAIGKEFNVTRERIRQIEKQAINKLKRKLERIIEKEGGI